MSGLLRGLRHPRPRGHEMGYPVGYSPHAAYNEALDDVLDRLRNPTDEQVRDAAVRTIGSCDPQEGDIFCAHGRTITWQISPPVCDMFRDECKAIRLHWRAAVG